MHSTAAAVLRRTRPVLAAVGLLAVCASPAVAVTDGPTTPLAVQHSVAMPITAGSPCAVEPRNAVYGNQSYNVSSPSTYGVFGAANLPAVEDLVPETRAGVPTDFCVGYAMQPDLYAYTRTGQVVDSNAVGNPSTHPVTGDDMGQVTIDLPPGVAGTLANVDTCTEADFDRRDGANKPIPATCPETSILGESFTRITSDPLGSTLVNSVIGGATSASGAPFQGVIYRLPAGPNEVGRIGVQITPDVISPVNSTRFTVRLILSPDGSGRVRAVVPQAPRKAFIGGNEKDIYVEAVWMRMWGKASDHPAVTAGSNRRPALKGDFIESSATCDAGLSAHVKVVTYGGSTSEVDTPGTTMTGCDQLPFAPTVSVDTTTRAIRSTTGVTVKLAFDQTPANGRSSALLRDAAVTLPAGLDLGAQVASGDGGLRLCSAAQFAEEQALVPAGCPAASAVGTVRIVTPLIEESLVGTVYLGEQDAVGSLPHLYLEAAFAGATAADAPRIKLVGDTQASEDGQVTATFLDAPLLRFSEMRLTFADGPHSLFVTPQRCGTTTGRAVLGPTGGALVERSPSLTVDQGCTAPLTTGVSLTPTNLQAGAFAPSVISIARTPESPWMDAIDLNLPSGFLANLNAATECPSAVAAVGGCPEASRIGTVVSYAGAGTATYKLVGALFLTERPAGAVAGATIVVQAKVGDLDLGTVIVPGRIDLRPTDAGMEFKTTVPQRFKGVALQLQRVDVGLDRPGFALNPSSCGPLPYVASITGVDGQVSTPSGSVAYAGCGALPFAPKLSASLTGETGKGAHPGMNVRVEQAAGSAGLGSAEVLLPLGLSTDPKNLQVTCSVEQFNANGCPAASKVGTAAAATLITPEVITGDVYLVKIPGKQLPGLGLNFTGRFAQRLLSTIVIENSRVKTTFGPIPDLPLLRLDLSIAPGPKSPLILPDGKKCGDDAELNGTFVAQGGQVAKSNAAICGPGEAKLTKAKVKMTDRSGLSVALSDFGGRKLSYVKVSLPKGWTFSTKQAKKKGAVSLKVTGDKTKITVRKSSIIGYSRGKKGTAVRLSLKGSVIKASRSAAKKSKAKVKVKFAFADGSSETQTITVTTKKATKKSSSKK